MNALPLFGIIALGIILGLVWYIRKIKSEHGSGGIAPSQLSIYSSAAAAATDVSRDHLEEFLLKSSAAKSRRLKLTSSRQSKNILIFIAIAVILLLAFINQGTIKSIVEDAFAGIGQILQGDGENGGDGGNGGTSPGNSQRESACTDLTFSKDDSGKVGLHSLPEITDQPSCYNIPDVKLWNSWFDDQQNKAASSARDSLAKSIIQASGADSGLTDLVVNAISSAGTDGVLHLPSKSGATAGSPSSSEGPDGQSGGSGSADQTPDGNTAQTDPNCGTAKIASDSIALDPQLSKNGPNCWNVEDKASWKTFFSTTQSSGGKKVTPDLMMQGFASFVISNLKGLDQSINQCKDSKNAAACDQVKKAVEESYSSGVLNLNSIQ